MLVVKQAMKAICFNVASNNFNDNKITDELKSNVQKSDPFLEKLLLEACCEISGLN